MSGRGRSWQGHAAAALLLAAGGVGAADYDFAYRLSGDQRVAPLQVFDDGASTWLQFQPGQAIPAIFESAAGGAGGRLVSYAQQGPYVVLNGTATALVLRVGDVVARAEYQGKAPRAGITASAPPVSPQWVDTPAAPGPVVAGVTAAGSAARAVAGAGLRAARGAGEPEVVATVAPVPAALVYDAAVSDGNMRRVIERWARQAGWTFSAEHWTVDVDIPLNGAASFGADFLDAVRGLLSATEMTARPLQPCFYANRVLRVVAYTQPCDRTMTPAGAQVAS